MKLSSEFTSSDLKEIAIKIREDIFKPANNFKTTIFLCGGALSEKDNMRHKVSKELSNYWYRHNFNLIYPEDIFDELLSSSKYGDLLSLEALLAESVDVIVLIPESPGSFAELGAFAHDERLRSKMICFVDDKYKKDKSFINQGPIKLVRNMHEGRIVYFNSEKPDNGIKKLNSILLNVRKERADKTQKITLLQVSDFLLPAIYLLEPVRKNDLIEMVGYVMSNSNFSAQATNTGLHTLNKEGYIERSQKGYKLTSSGIKKFLQFRKLDPRVKTQKETVEIDNLRLEVLNLRYRRKKLKIR